MDLFSRSSSPRTVALLRLVSRTILRPLLSLWTSTLSVTVVGFRKETRLLVLPSLYLFDYSLDIFGHGNIVAVGAPLSSARVPRGGQLRVFRFVEERKKQLGNAINGESTMDRLDFATSLPNDGFYVANDVFSNISNGKVSVHKYDLGSLEEEQRQH